MDNSIEKINKSSMKFLEPITLEKTYETIVKEAIKLVNAEHGSIFLAENNHLTRVYASSPTLYEITIRKKGYTFQAYKKKRAYVLHIHEKNVNKIHPAVNKLNIRSTIYLPLVYKKKPLGVLSVDTSKVAHFSKKELKILELFSSTATMAIIKMQLYDQAQKALESRDVFIARAAHQLRTPLTTMIGYLQLLNTRFKQSKQEELIWLEKVQKESKRLSNLINEFLEINRIRAGKSHFEFQESDFIKIINESIEEFRYLFPKRILITQNKLQGKKHLIISDEYKLKQAIINILENAAKYSDNKTKINLSITSSKHNFKVTVEDKGIGISAEELRNIFGANFRAKSNTFDEGMGWGLFLAFNVIKHHKGMITIKSKLKRGTVVTIKLPIHQ